MVNHKKRHLLIILFVACLSVIAASSLQHPIVAAQSAYYQITVTQSPNGVINPDTFSTYPVGSNPSETVTPNPGYTIATITVDGGSVPVTASMGQAQTYPFTNITANHSITATFVPIYQITVTQSSHGTISPATASYTQGSSQNEVITPDSGYGIANITVDGGSVPVTALNGQPQTVSFNNIQAAHSITATFAQFYQITVTQSGNGVITPATATYLAGSNPSETITPSSGYNIASITVDGKSETVTSPSGQTVDLSGIKADHSITATFAQITWTITVTQPSNGVISPATASYVQGTSQTETITPSTGYSISSITVDGSSVPVTSPSGQTYTFNNIQAAHTITATFAQNTYTVAVTINPSPAAGMVTGYVTTQTYNYGDAVTLTESPGNGYTFSSWSGDGTGTGTTRTVTVTGNMSVTATFTQNTYSITTTVAPTGGGTVAPNAPGPYHYGDIVLLTESPSNGYIFSGWGGDGTGTGATRTVTVTGNMVVAASFTQSAYSVVCNSASNYRRRLSFPNSQAHTTTETSLH